MPPARPGRWAFVVDHSLLLVAGAVIGLAWANTSPGTYARAASALRFPVNDIGMVFFFALAAKEIIEARLPGGPLASPRQAAVPLLAAVGGMAVPAGLYVLLATLLGHRPLLGGWAIPTATDIAFSYLAARLIFPRTHPAVPFLLLLAIADDALGLVLLAVCYPSGPLSAPAFAALMAPALAVAWWLRRRTTRSAWPYVTIAGGLSWGALHLGGVHPALALIPILPFMPHAERDLGLFEEAEAALPDTLNVFERAWKTPVQFILLLFGLANAGVPFAGTGPGTWIVLACLVLGKPAGILLATFLSVRAGLGAPGGIGFRDVAVVGIAAGTGLTVALFFATAAFPAGPLLDQVKMGALLSFVAAPLAVLAGRLTAGARPAPPVRGAP